MRPAAERLSHRRDGRYLIAPDSADPLPSAIWTRGDLETLASETDRADNNLARGLSEAERRRPDPALFGIFHVALNDRRYLEQIGGDAARRLIQGLNRVERGDFFEDDSLRV